MLAPRPGLEPGTPALTVRCFYQLSYRGKKFAKDCAHDSAAAYHSPIPRTRGSGSHVVSPRQEWRPADQSKVHLPLRRRLLYPVELAGQGGEMETRMGFGPMWSNAHRTCKPAPSTAWLCRRRRIYSPVQSPMLLALQVHGPAHTIRTCNPRLRRPVL